jgi:hypothetical protein
MDHLLFKGREFASPDLARIGALVAERPALTRHGLATALCELLDWRRPSGELKIWEARDLLATLEAVGEIRLPPLRVTKPRGSHTSIPHTVEGEPQAPVEGTVRDVAPVTLRRVTTECERARYRELVGRYHYLGHTVPFGAQIRYFVEVARPAPRIAGCLLVSSPAWRMAVRDRWIGWSDTARRARLQRVVQHSRFVILPWFRVRGLASHILGGLARAVRKDWPESYAIEPLLLESLVDPRFSGTAYRAANWIELGSTTGRGRMDRTHARHGAAPKRVFVYPLVRHARAILCGGL